MAQGIVDFDQIKNEVLQKLSVDDNADYSKLESNPDDLKEAEAAMKRTYDELKHMISNADSLDSALKHLPPERQTLIKTTFRLQSFKVDMQRQADGSVNLWFSSIEGTPLSFVPMVVKLDSKNYEENRILLDARIVFEIVTLVLNFIGLVVIPSAEAIAEAIAYISKILVSQTSIVDDIDKMIAAAKAGDMSGVAKAIVACLIDLYKGIGAPIIRIVKIILLDKSWKDKIIAIAQVLSFIATMIASAAGVVVKVIEWLLKATEFVMKLLQRHDFNSIKLD